MTDTQPFSSIEVRWFAGDTADANAGLRDWFAAAEPFRRAPGVGRPRWQPRSDGKPDVYLVLPGIHDMGIKLREGLVQIKGRIASLGPTPLGGTHTGNVERWCKWSYSDPPPALGALFRDAGGPRRRTLSVTKTRALRLLALTDDGDCVETTPGRAIERGIAAELTALEVGGTAFVSLAFEAFPDDAPMRSAFSSVVARFLHGCHDERLDASRSESYPRFLDRLPRAAAARD